MIDFKESGKNEVISYKKQVCSECCGTSEKDKLSCSAMQLDTFVLLASETTLWLTVDIMIIFGCISNEFSKLFI